jgi:dipeptidyl aminopeptidase/acylaminoacyl peptidase
VKARWAILPGVLLALAGCQFFPDPYLIYPEAQPPQVIGWTDNIERGALRVHLEWARPAGDGPFPTVLVHPGGGKPASSMRGVIHDLAGRGYAAAGIHYQRYIDGKFRSNTFPWRSHEDVLASLDIVSEHAFVDRDRIATLGFSQGGIFSLLIAAHAPERIRAVAAYYPVTDFEHWFATYRPDPIERFVYRVIRWHFYRESGAQSEEEFMEMLHQASPLRHAEAIRAPVLLVHGDRDRAASVEESRRLAERLQALGREVRLLVVPGAVHIFNFRQPEPAVFAWRETLDWLERQMHAGGNSPIN